MRSIAIALFAISTAWIIPTATYAQQANSCKDCGDQRRRCMSNYSGPTCQTEYQRCMKDCKKK